MNLKELRNKLEQCWDEKTGFSKGKGSEGQCYVTSLLLNQLFSGEIMHGRVGRKHHFWNRIDGREIDFTSDQYGGNGFDPIIEGKVFSKPNFKNRRFLILKRRFECLQ